MKQLELASRICWLCALIASFAPSSILLAEELARALSETSAQYEGYYYEEYQFVATGDAALTIAMESGDFDTFLFLLDPDGVPTSNDDHPDLGNVRPSNDTDAGIRVDRPTAGLWKIIATTYQPNTLGQFTILSEGIEDLRPIESDEQDSAALEKMFASRGVVDRQEERQRQVAELAEQLSLPTFRAKLYRTCDVVTHIRLL